MMNTQLGYRLFVTIVIAGVLAVIGIGLSVSGSPGHARSERFDEQRAQQLQNISSMIAPSRQLPQNLDDVPGFDSTSFVDPETHAPYEYHLIGTTGYQLCATFDTDTRNQKPLMLAPRAPYPINEGLTIPPDFTRHAAGRACFFIHLASKSPSV